jgi:tRNA pseudouridine38-40 synthase
MPKPPDSSPRSPPRTSTKTDVQSDGPAGASAGGPVRVRLDIGYDGTEFSGWARQPGRRTVQETLESALTTLVGAPITLTVAGRTDAGGHATGQVAHTELPSTVDTSELVRRLHRLLPPDVTVPSVRLVPAEFDARFSALRRHYRYRIADQPLPIAPLRRRDTLRWPRRLDDDAMAAATVTLLGQHDFAAFCRRREGATTVRDLQRLNLSRDADGVLQVNVTADAFCHNMVRSLVGALIAVGDGRRSPTWPATLLELRERSSEVTVAPPHGLTLTAIDYPPDHQLAARANKTRRLRIHV